MKAAKLAHKPLGTVLGLASGLLVGALFNQVWRAVSHTDHVPHPTEEEQHWGPILLAAALQGATFGLVRAAVDRGSAQLVRRLTGEWPS